MRTTLQAARDASAYTGPLRDDSIDHFSGMSLNESAGGYAVFDARGNSLHHRAVDKSAHHHTMTEDHFSNGGMAIGNEYYKEHLTSTEKRLINKNKHFELFYS